MLYKLDMMSKEPGLKASKRSRHKSAMGIVFTVLAILTSLAYAIFALVEYGNKKLISLSMAEGANHPNSTISFKDSRLFPMISAANMTAQEVLEWMHVFVIYNYSTDASDTRGHIFSRLAPCSQLFKDGHLGLYEMEGMDSFFQNDTSRLCVNKSDLDVKGFGHAVDHRKALDENQSLNFKAVIDSASFNKMNDNDYYGSRSFDLKTEYIALKANFYNFDSPVAFSSQTQFVSFRYYAYFGAAFAKQEHTLLKTIVKDDIGFPFKETIRLEAYSVEPKESVTTPEMLEKPCDSVTDPDICPSMFHLKLVLGPKLQEVSRKYTSLTDVIGSIGGFQNIIWLIFSYAYLFLFAKDDNQRLAASVFKIKKEKSKCLPCQKKQKQSAIGEPGEAESPAGKANCKRVSASDFTKVCDTVSELMDVNFIVKELATLRLLVTFCLNDADKELASHAGLAITMDEIVLKDQKDKTKGENQQKVPDQESIVKKENPAEMEKANYEKAESLRSNQPNQGLGSEMVYISPLTGIKSDQSQGPGQIKINQPLNLTIGQANSREGMSTMRDLIRDEMQQLCLDKISNNQLATGILSNLQNEKKTLTLIRTHLNKTKSQSRYPEQAPLQADIGTGLAQAQSNAESSLKVPK